jgi:hypothetical protein
MGSNPTQAQGVLAFLVAFTFIAAGLAADVNFLWIIIGGALLGASAALFVKCKPWEHNEE